MPEPAKTCTGSYSISLILDADDEVRKLVDFVENFGAEWERRRDEMKWPPSSEGMITAAILSRGGNR